MTNLYFAETHYHVLLSISHARQHDSEAVLGIRAEAEGIDELQAALEDTDSNPFSEIQLFSHALEEQVTKRKLRRYSAIFRTLGIAARNSIDTVYGFTDRFLANQLLFYGLRHVLDTDVEFIEDGAAAYASLQYSPKHKLPNWLPNKAVFGPWWRPVNVLGTSGYSSTIWLTHPELARPELEELTQRRVESHLSPERDASWVQNYILKVSGEPVPDDISTIFMAPHFSIVDDPNSLMETVTDQAPNGSGDSRIGVKYHPREYETDYLRVAESDMVELPRGVPSEMYYLAMPNLENVLGGMTTSLLSANWLADDVDLTCLLPEDVDQDERFASVMDEIGADTVDVQ